MSFAGAPGTSTPLLLLEEAGSGWAATLLPGVGPLDPSSRAPTPVLALPLARDTCTRVCLSLPPAPAAAAPLAPPPSPFPPPSYPAEFLGADTATGGAWLGKYGSAGHALFAYDGPGPAGDLVLLPPYVAALRQTFGHAQSGPWPTDGNDTRALQARRGEGREEVASVDA